VVRGEEGISNDFTFSQSWGRYIWFPLEHVLGFIVI
jgi:hypothetical protein